jgi:hypothetical protein
MIVTPVNWYHATTALKAMIAAGWSAPMAAIPIPL